MNKFLRSSLLLSLISFASSNVYSHSIEESICPGGADIFGTSALGNCDNKRVRFSLDSPIILPADIDSVDSMVNLRGSVTRDLGDCEINATKFNSGNFGDEQISDDRYAIKRAKMTGDNNDVLSLTLGSMYSSPHTVTVKCSGMDMDSSLSDLVYALDNQVIIE